MSPLRKPRHPVVVSRSELEALMRSWSHFLRTDMQIDPLAEAIHRLARRLKESESARPFNSSASMTEPVPGGTIVTIEINQTEDEPTPPEKVETTETTETETTEKVEVTEKPADADEDE